MDDLVTFLRARLDEDEQAARAAKPGPWAEDGGSVHATHPTDEVVSYTESATHIARHDPARVLAEVEAKRRILDLHYAELVEAKSPDGEDREGLWCWECDGEPFPCRSLRLLALPYADHPDYQETWRP